MKLVSKKLALVPLMLFAGWLVAAQARAGVLGYPSTDHASFLVDIPDGWEVSPGEEEGDFVDVNSESGVYLAFRTIAGSESAMQEAIEESVAYLEENYKNVSLGEATDAKQAGLEGFYMDGTGKDADGSGVVFRMAWLALKDGHIGEIWFAAPADDKAGIAAAGKTLNSFRAP
ncbi:MAG: hypothetical protein ABIV06_07180 [Thermoanaerobaculia bacterium]